MPHNINKSKIIENIVIVLWMYNVSTCKVDVDTLNAVKSVLADILRAKARNVSQHTLYGVQHICINLIQCTFYRHADADADQN